MYVIDSHTKGTLNIRNLKFITIDNARFKIGQNKARNQDHQQLNQSDWHEWLSEHIQNKDEKQILD